jgi:pimeloyl-ACP methyl ester carboxylesterase
VLFEQREEFRMTDGEIYQAAVTRRTRSLVVRGIKYCLNEWGDDDAPLLFYLHGWADTGSTFQFVVDALVSRWRVVAPDWRGFGRTAHAGGPYWFPDYLADLHDILEHYSPDAPVRLLGHSMGGNIASLYAGSMPERVNAIVNIEGFGLPDSDPDDAPERYRGWLEAQTAGTDFSFYPDYSGLARRIRSRNPGLSEDRAEFVARQWAREDNGAVRLRADPMHKLPNPILYRRAEATACWRNISAPVLLVSGEKSAFKGQVTDLASGPATLSCEIEGVGHMIHFEAPEILAAHIEQFLKKPL